MATLHTKERNILSSPRLDELKRKRKRVLRNKIILYILGFLIILVGLNLLSRIPALSIKSVEVRGANILDPKNLKENIESVLNEKFIVFSKRNVFFYSKSKIEKILSSIPRIKSFDINRENFNNLVIDIVERDSKYTWCGESLPVDDLVEVNNMMPKETQCYFMDGSGYIFDEAPYFSGDVYFKFFGKTELNSESVAGSYFIPNTFEKILIFKNNLEKMGFKLSSLLVKSDGDMELYLSLNSALPNTPKIIFKSDADFDRIAENLQAVITEEPLKSDFQKKYSSLLYIDLRFGNKVYYKFQ
ncbi:MAG: hypothetical protein WAV23_02095 [Minisyncoccia bacterium]